MTMQLFPKPILDRLLANGAASCASPEGVDHIPVVKIFAPWNAATWLLSEVMPHEPDLAFGLYDFGFGSPELGYVNLSDLVECTGGGLLRLKLERDLHWTGKHPVSVYATAARQAGRVVSNIPKDFAPC